MPKYIDPSDIMLITDKVTNNIITKGLITGVFVGYVSHTSTGFPTTRLDGNPIKDYDYVRPDSSSQFPFTINGIKFVNRFNRAFYLSGNWIFEAGEIPKTNEVSTSDPINESLSESAENQYNINIENKLAIKTIENCLGHKLDVYKSMPEPRIDYNELIVLYAGKNDLIKNYKTGHLYQCLETSPGVFSWEDLYSSSVRCDNITIEENALGQIQVKDSGISETKLSTQLKEELYKVSQDSDIIIFKPF